jgi:hypothetical protein
MHANGDGLKNRRIMHRVRDEWLDEALFAGEWIDEDGAHEGIEWLYSLAGMSKPAVEMYESPRAVQERLIGGESFAALLKRGAEVFTGQEPSNYIASAIHRAVEKHVCNSAWYPMMGEEKCRKLVAEVRSRVAVPVYQATTHVGDVIERDLMDTFKRKFFRFSQHSLLAQLDDVAYCDFFCRLGLLQDDNFDRHVQFLKSGVFLSYWYDSVALVCPRPSLIRRNTQGRLHSEEGWAMGWRDGYRIHCLYGIPFHEGLWEQVVLRKLRFTEVMGIPNIERRIAALRMMDPDEMLRGAQAEKIHESKRGNSLYCVKLFVGDRPGYVLRYACPSTGKVYLKGIPREVAKKKNADEAQAWTHHFTLSEYLQMTAES